MATAEKQLDDPRLHFRNMPRVDAAAFLASRARYLVIHLDWAREEARCQKWPLIERDLSKELNGEARKLAETVGRSWGNPVYRDRQIVVWDMDRVRKRMAGSGGPAKGAEG